MGYVDYDTLTERIQFICYKLEHYTFLSAEDRKKLLQELRSLVEQRNKLTELLGKDEK